MTYNTLIGIEIHVELSTKNKVFCNCKNLYGQEANTLTCPVCLGLPGGLPVIDKEALEYAIMAGLAFNSQIARTMKMDRKNYFYPDLTKGYQISQANFPLCEGGFVEISLPEGKKQIGLIRIHLEEDTGKQIHLEDGSTLLDFNRCGVPLIEIVSKPDMTNSIEAKLFLEEIRSTLKYIGISDVRMEEGSLRCDININVIDKEKGLKSNITEIKNLNSFRAAVKAIEYEEKRHIQLLEKGENSVNETRRWDEEKQQTIQMRRKLGASDYRFAAEADLPPFHIDENWLSKIKNTLPELPAKRKERFIKSYLISEYEAEVLTKSKELSEFFEKAVETSKDSKLVCNWVMGDVLRRLNEEEKDPSELTLSVEAFTELLELVKTGKVNNNTAKSILKEMMDTGISAGEVVKRDGLVQISDESELEVMADEILAANPQSIEDFKNGKDRAVGFLVGQVMKQSKGKANPQKVNELIIKKLNNM